MSDLDFIRPPPSYLEYPTDLLGNMNYRLMSLAERGLFHTLRLELWIHGKLPADIEKLAVILGVPTDEVQKLFSDYVGAFFEINDGFITCPELVDYRAKQERRRRRQSEGGAIGGRRTQERSRELQSDLEQKLEANLKVTNRRELSRKGGSRNELYGCESKHEQLSDFQQEWVDDFSKNNDW